MRDGFDTAVTRALTKFSKAFRRPITDVTETLRVWVAAMDSAFITPQDIDEGADALVRHETRFPPPATLREYAIAARRRRLERLEHGILRTEADPEVCPLCGAVGFWERHGIAPERGTPGTRHYQPARAFVRFEDWHQTGCARRDPDQPLGDRPEAPWQVPADLLARRRPAAPPPPPRPEAP